MKKKLKLGRGKQTVGFLMLTALLLCLFWGFLGYPLPTEEMEFRRLERQRLVQTNGEVLRFSVGGMDYIGALGEGRFNLCVPEDDWLESFQVPEGGGLLPVFGSEWYTGEYALLMAGVPEDGDRAELKLDLSAWSYESPWDDPLENRVFLELPHGDPGMKGIYREHSWQYVVEGEKLAAGSFLFRIRPYGDMWADEAEVDDVAEECALFYIGRPDHYEWAQEGRPPGAEFQAEATCYSGTQAVAVARLDLMTQIQGQ